MRVWLCLCAFALVAAAGAGGGAGANCRATPVDAFGPFGRGEPPLRAKIGTGHVLTGTVLSSLGCDPVRGAHVQLWQAGRDGRYTRAGSGTVVTDRAGHFRFEGPYPPAYEGVPPHIHIRVFARGHESLLTRYLPAAGARRGSVRLVLVPDEL